MVVNWIESPASKLMMLRVAETSAYDPPLELVSLRVNSSIARPAVAVIVATFCTVSDAGPPELDAARVTVPAVRVSTSTDNPVSDDAAVREAEVAPVPIAAHFGLPARA